MYLIEDIFWLKRYSGAYTGAKFVRLIPLSSVKSLKHTEVFCHQRRTPKQSTSLGGYWVIN